MENNFDLKKFLVENKLTTNSRMLNEDELIIKKVARDVYKALTSYGFKMTLLTTNSKTRQIGKDVNADTNNLLSGKTGYKDKSGDISFGSYKGSELMIGIRLFGDENLLNQIKNEFWKKFPQLEPVDVWHHNPDVRAVRAQKDRKEGDATHRVEIKAKMKTTSKGGYASNTPTNPKEQ